MRLFPFAARLPRAGGCAATSSRAYRLGRAGARGARVRDDRRRLAGGRPVRGAGRAAPLRGASAARGIWSRDRWRRPRRCRPRPSATSPPGSGRVRRAHRRAGAVVGVARCSPGCCGSGFLASFISEPVLKGFIVGLALTIIVGQLPKLFGVEKGDGDFFEQLWDLARRARRHERPRRSLVGARLARARARAAARSRRSCRARSSRSLARDRAVELFDLDDHGVDIVGTIDSGLPSLGLPDVGAARLPATSAPARSASCSSASPRASARPRPTPRATTTRSTPTASCSGSAAPNLAAGLSSGMVVNGSLSKTAVNASAGARTQLSGLVVAALTIVTLLFLTGLFETLPEATLAAVVIAALIELVDVPALVRLYRVYTRRLGRIYGVAARPDFIAAVAALLGVLVFDTLPGLFIGIARLAAAAALPRLAAPRRRARARAGRPRPVRRHRAPPRERARPTGIVVLRVEGGLFFANADDVRAPRSRAHAARRRRAARSCSTPRPCRSSTSPRPQMLDELADDLQRRRRPPAARARHRPGARRAAPHHARRFRSRHGVPHRGRGARADRPTVERATLVPSSRNLPSRPDTGDLHVVAGSDDSREACRRYGVLPGRSDDPGGAP